MGILKQVLEKITTKYENGVKEHGGMDIDDKTSIQEWVAMLQEEHIDAVCYCEKILEKLDKQKD